MKIRVFTLNRDNKIELTEAELKRLLDESYEDGKNDARTTTISTPSYPYWYDSITTTVTGSADSATANGTITF